MPPYTEHGLPTSGTTAQRPTNAEIGFRYFDTTLGQSMSYTGSAWVLSDGNSPGAPATVAATGTVQANAALIGTGFTLVSAADGNKGVLLPPAAAGLVCHVKNNAAAILKVWPNTSDGINAVGANTNFNMASLTSASFYAYDATTWYTIPLVAS